MARKTKKADALSPENIKIETDAQALTHIVSWSADKPEWQRQAAKLLLRSNELGNIEINELYAQALSGATATSPIAVEDVRIPQSVSKAVSLKAVCKPQDVNALASDQDLTFNTSGLTVVYGDNGAGKSGYARILKHACRARIEAKPAPVLANIYAVGAGTPRAKITFFVGDQKRIHDWQLDKGSPAELSAVSVFDSRTASVHVDGLNDVAYTPSSLDLLQRLAKVCEAIRDKAKAEQVALGRQTPESLKSPPIAATSPVGEAITKLAATTNLATFEALAVLSNDEIARLDELRRDFSGDPTKAANRVLQQAAGLERFSVQIASLCASVTSVKAVELKTLSESRRATRAAADAAAKGQFASDPLPNIGSATWRELWESARRYANNDAYIGEAFPTTGNDARCVLCQQTLSDQAKDRFQRFEDFVKDDTKQRADAAEKAYSEVISTMANAKPSIAKLRQQLNYIRVELGDSNAYQATKTVCLRAAWQLRRVARNHDDSNIALVDVEPGPALAELTRITSELRARASALTASNDAPERKALVSEMRDLEARTWLKSNLPDVRSEILRKQKASALDQVMAQANTRSITDLVGQLAENLVTDVLRARFAKEVSELGVAALALELKKESSQAGAARFRVRLVRKPDAPVGQILSEGEHRCVALAAFLAELATTGSKSAIIFDDPVSSLDHNHRDKVAARLVAEAKVRQVIVLTHDVAFLMLLDNSARESQVQIGFRCVSRGADSAGYCSTDLPHNVLPVASVLSAIEADVSNKAVLWQNGRQADWRNAVKASLQQLRDAWERGVEEFVGPVVKRLSNKVDTKSFAKLTVLEMKDCDAMRNGYGTCSVMLHSAGESLNLKLPTPDEILAEVKKLKDWHTDLQERQDKIKAA